MKNINFEELRSNEFSFPLAKETIDVSDINTLIEWLLTGPRLTKWKLTEEFEQKWSEYIGTTYSVFVNSGSSANLLMIYALKELGRLNGKVIVPSVGWITTISPLLHFGIEPIMVDADEKTFGIDLEQTEFLLKTEDISAIIFVQVLGVPHYKDELRRLSEKYGVPLLEDGCASLGSSYEDGTMVGQVGVMSSFSFYFGHQFSTIEGGMINTDDEELYHTLLMLRSHGWGKDLPKELYKQKMVENNIDIFHEPFTFLVPGFNLRSTDLQAFIGIRQLVKSNWITQQRTKNHLEYAKQLFDHFEFQNWGNDNPCSISFGVLAESKEHRKDVVNRLVENGIETRIFSAGNLGLHPFWVNRYGEFHGEVADKIHSRGFFLPNYPELETEDINFISEVCKNVKK
jgi:CDP-6-deoxy-D-xylo-4-hexulose-3-dehydrase